MISELLDLLVLSVVCGSPLFLMFIAHLKS
jgi:hypothetical protein